MITRILTVILTASITSMLSCNQPGDDKVPRKFSERSLECDAALNPGDCSSRNNCAWVNQKCEKIPTVGLGNCYDFTGLKTQCLSFTKEKCSYDSQKNTCEPMPCTKMASNDCQLYARCFKAKKGCEDRIATANDCQDLHSSPEQCRAFKSGCFYDSGQNKCAKISCPNLSAAACSKNAQCFLVENTCENRISTVTQCSDLNASEAQCNAHDTGKSCKFAAGVCVAAKGRWDWGTSSIGTGKDDPFFNAAPPGNCDFAPGEKQAIIDSIANPITPATMAKNPNTNAPIAIFTVGAPGCGKSSSLAQVKQVLLNEGKISNLNGFVHIDPDDARDRMTAFKDAISIPNKSPLRLHKLYAYKGAVTWCRTQGSELKTDLVTHALTNNKSFIYDTPCAFPNICKTEFDNAVARGYEIYVFGVWAQAQTCKDRARDRALATGRWTGPNFVGDYHDRINQVINPNIDMGAMFNNALDSFVFDNDAPGGAGAALIYRKSNQPCTPGHAACTYYNR